MGRRSKSQVLSDFTGGMNSDSSPTSLELNEAIDLNNVILLPKSGFKKTNGNSTYNSSAMDSGAAVHGSGFYRNVSAVEVMMQICGTKIFKSEFDGTMDDITGAVTISSGQDNIWTYNQMNDLGIFVGGNRSADVPLKWSGSGNAAALGGTPPVGQWCTSANNRLFIANTIAAPSRIYWSILGNPEDWSGAGSGSQDVALNDGDNLVGACLLSTDHLLLFKQNSTHDLIVRTSPFPLFPLFPKIGAISSRAILNVDGVCFFVTAEPRMKATDGAQLVDFPDTFDSVWESLNKSRLQYIQGIYDKKRSLVMWFCSYGDSTSNDFCIAWDLKRKAWLKFSKGHNFNTAAMMQDRTFYGGGYAGKVYKLDDSTTANYASEGGIAIDSYWRSGWMDMGEMINMKNIPYVDLNFSTQSSGTFDFSYGYDFDSDRNSFTVNMRGAGGLFDQAIFDQDVFGGATDKTKLNFLKGNGKFFQFFIRNNNLGEDFQFNRIAFPAKIDAPSI